MVEISVYNKATVPLGLDLAALVPALQSYVTDFLVPAWGCPAILRATAGPVAGTWGMVFLDDADVEGALAYHDEESHLPLAKVFVRTTLENGESLSGSASHELAEMLVDPACVFYALGPDGVTMYAVEVADAVEETSFDVKGFPMSNFCLPAWFQPDPIGQVKKFDHCGELTQAFDLAKGGYAITCKAGSFGQVFGSEAKAARFAREDRRGHRSEYRMR